MLVQLLLRRKLRVALVAFGRNGIVLGQHMRIQIVTVRKHGVTRLARKLLVIVVIYATDVEQLLVRMDPVQMRAQCIRTDESNTAIRTLLDTNDELAVVSLRRHHRFGIDVFHIGHHLRDCVLDSVNANMLE